MQFGLDAVMEVICAFSDLSVGLDEVSSRRNSWRLLGGRVKRRGRAMFATVVLLVAIIIIYLFILPVVLLVYKFGVCRILAVLLATRRTRKKFCGFE